MKATESNIFHDLPCKAEQIDKELLMEKGSHQTLLRCKVGLLDFSVSIRRHENWGTYTVDGMVDFDNSEDVDQMIAIINDISSHQVQLYRCIQKELFDLGILSARNADGSLEFGDGRWLHVGAAMASYNSNEYVFDFSMDEASEEMRETIELIEREARLCALALRSACSAFFKITRKKMFSQQLERVVPPNFKEIDPLVHRFRDVDRTREVRLILREAYQSIQLADAHLLRGGYTVH
ncbi:MAG: hypothetical protein GY859_31060 [Desulfobacterales bacterium]|nr:hypothetical protein [Desulfobacterales bacterium]